MLRDDVAARTTKAEPWVALSVLDIVLVFLKQLQNSEDPPTLRLAPPLTRKEQHRGYALGETRVERSRGP